MAKAPKVRPKPMKMTVFGAALARAGIPMPEREVVFHPGRRWRFDYAWPDRRVALEVEGGVWTRGRHTRGSGFIADLEKYSTAAAEGWAVLRTTPSALCDVATLNLILQARALPEREAP